MAKVKDVKIYEGDYSRIDEAKAILKGKGGRKRRFETPEALAKACKSYFNSCWRPKVDGDGKLIRAFDDKGNVKLVFEQFKPYTMSGLALHLGISSEALRKYGKDEKYAEIVETARQYVEMYTEEQLMNGVANAKVSLEHNFRWNKSDDDRDDVFEVVFKKAEEFKR